MKKIILSLLVVSTLIGSIIKATDDAPASGARTGAGGAVGGEEFDAAETAKLIAAVQAGNLVAVKAALDHGADPNAKDNLDCTPLHNAAQLGHLDVVQALLAAGAEVNAKDNVDRTPLHNAARRGHLKAVRFLLAAGAEVDAKSYSGYTPLYWAAAEGHLKNCKTLT